MRLVRSADDTRIWCAESGHGPPLLLVHGTTADHTRWAGVSSHLREHFTVYAVDRRGRGNSCDAAGYHLEREAEDVAAVVDAIGEPVSLLGHSYGAVCCLEATLLTTLVDRMVLYEPPIPTGVPMYPPGVPDRMQELIDSGKGEAALELFYLGVVGMAEAELAEYRQLPNWERRVGLASTIPRELAFDRTYSFDPERFAGLAVPTLLLLGGDSPPLFRRGVEAIDGALPNSTVVALSGQQHIAMDTNPEMFIGEVLQFLEVGG